MEYSGAQDAYGIAYGWDEVEYARRTIHLVREQLWAAKSFAHSVTVPRFIRDAQRAARGERDFEGAMWSHDLYPRGLVCQSCAKVQKSARRLTSYRNIWLHQT